MDLVFAPILELLQVRVRDVFSDKIMIYTGAAKNRRQEPVYMSEGCKRLAQSMNLHLFNPDDFVFGYQLKTCDKMFSRNRVSVMHQKVLRALGMNKYHDLYSWKHSGAEAFYKAHKDPLRLMKHLRHTDMKSTLKYIRSLGLDYENVGIADF